MRTQILEQKLQRREKKREAFCGVELGTCRIEYTHALINELKEEVDTGHGGGGGGGGWARESRQ
jgi:hypothetical protein